MQICLNIIFNQIYFYFSNGLIIYRMQRESHDQELESDNDEGFIPSKIIIKQKKQFHGKKDKYFRQPNNEFIPRYITDGIMRKQPPECYNRFSKFDFISEHINSSQAIEDDQPIQYGQSQTNTQQNDETQGASTQRRKVKQQLSTPYDKYIASGEYMLVYSRYKDFKFSNQEINFASNQVRLDCLRSTQEFRFKPIKPFELIQDRKQSLLTQGLNRNTSIRQPLLQFDSKFQCGNLLCAFKHKNQPYTYTLFIQNDTNSYGYNQWFYFSVRNVQTKTNYKFNIVNFRKRHSFFREGNTPVVFSLIDSKKQGMSGYSKRGENIHYGKSPIIKSYDSKEKFYQLSFNLEFMNEDDCCYISMGLPYSYSKLLHNLNIYEEVAKQNNIKFQMESIGTSIAGNKIPYITITQEQDDFSKSQGGSPCINMNMDFNFNFTPMQDTTFPSHMKTQYEPQIQKKKVILIMGRQHPGQTWSSYLMDQFIRNLVSLKNPQSAYILQNFIIKIFPMINVDGVITGNFRCDLSGMDLNRNWKTPSSLLHPQIFSIKNEIISLVNQNYKIETCFDFHGHSKQYNVFCYSCKTQNQECRILPYIFSEINEEFHFPFCTFGISPYKKSTARAVIFSIIKNTNVLTVQTSFFGSKLDGKFKVFQPQNFDKMASTLIKGCKSYMSQDQMYYLCKQTVKAKLQEFMQYKSAKQEVLSGSDSEPLADQIDLAQKLQRIVPKNLISQCIVNQSPKKFVKASKKLKRKTFQPPQNRLSRPKQQSFNFLNKNSTIDVIPQSPNKQIKTNWETIKVKKKPNLQARKSHFKKNSILIHQQAFNESKIQKESNKKLLLKDISDRSEKKLSLFLREKPSLAPIRFKNESFEIFRDAYNATQKYIKISNECGLEEMGNSKLYPSKKIGIFKQAREKQLQEFPLLCVLSETKKKTHVQKIKKKRESNSSNTSKDEKIQQKIKTAIQTRTEAIKKLREKDKDSMELVSKIWRQNFTRYGMAFSSFKISK